MLLLHAIFYYHLTSLLMLTWSPWQWVIKSWGPSAIYWTKNPFFQDLYIKNRCFSQNVNVRVQTCMSKYSFLSVKIRVIVLSTCWQIEYIGLLVKSIFNLLLKFCSLTHKDNHYIYGRTTSYIIELVKQTLILLDHIYNHQSQTCRDGSGYQEILISGFGSRGMGSGWFGFVLHCS